MSEDARNWAFHHFYHADKANAAFHMSPVRFSPITFALAKAELAGCEHIEEVLGDWGKYPLDAGRIAEDDQAVGWEARK